MKRVPYKIPLFDLNYGEPEQNIVRNVLRSKWISMGEKTAAFESAFARCLGIEHVVALSSGTAALHLALSLLGIREGSEVIVPSLTFVATVNAVRYVRAIPVFADVTGFDDFSLDPHDVETKISSKTKAIIVMHYGGFACEMDKIMQLAKRHNIVVIEDAAHSPYSEYKGRRLGTIGDIGCFSFFSNKNISCAEGGALATRNEEHMELARLLRSHGMTALSYEKAKGHATNYDVKKLGYNYRLDDIRAALALVQVNKLRCDMKRRSELRELYISELGTDDRILIPYRDYPYKSSNYIFPVLLRRSDVKKRDVVRAKMAKAGVQTSVHYPAVHRFTIYKKFKRDLPKTDYISDNQITLPLYFALTKKNVRYVARMLREVL